MDGLIEEDSLTGDLAREQGEKSGTYSIKQGTLINENNPNYDITFIQGTFTIAKCVLSVGMFGYPTTVPEFPYDGLDKRSDVKRLITCKGIFIGNLDFKFYKQSVLSVALDRVADVGDYEFTIEPNTVSSKNYISSEALKNDSWRFKITKVNRTSKDFFIGDAVYDGTSQAIKIYDFGGNLINTSWVLYKVGDRDWTKIPPKDAGTYDVKFCISGDKNYENGIIETTYLIRKATLSRSNFNVMVEKGNEESLD